MVGMTKTVGANAERARSHNRQMVLDRVRRAGQIGRAEIARGSGLSTQAVSNIIAGLLEDGLIAQQGRRASGRGQPPVQYGLNADGGYAIGIEIRPDAVFAAVRDFCGSPVAEARHALSSQDLPGVTRAVQAAQHAILRDAMVPQDRLLGTGIVMPGPFGPTGLSGTGSELPILHDVEPAQWFSDALSTTVVVENDANAAAVAERLSGVATSLESFAFVYFGNGLGLGILQNGRLVTGAFGNAGELGHIPVTANGQAVALETVLSRFSVQQHLQRHGHDIADTDGLARAYTAGLPALLQWLDAATQPLAQAVTIVENILDPEAIVLGGAMPDSLIDHLVATTKLATRSVANRPKRPVARLLRGTTGRMTGALGAAALVLNQEFTPRITTAA